MGRDPNEHGGRKSPKKPQAGATPDFWSWHPTEGDRESLDRFCQGDAHLNYLIDACTKLGITFTITRTKTGDGLCVVARNRFDDFGSGQALSVFHSDPIRALWGMMYVLTVLHPDWPSEPVTTSQRAFDW